MITEGEDEQVAKRRRLLEEAAALDADDSDDDEEEDEQPNGVDKGKGKAVDEWVLSVYASDLADVSAAPRTAIAIQTATRTTKTTRQHSWRNSPK